MNDEIVVVDFGGQYAQLISRRIKDIGVQSRVVPCDRATMQDIAEAKGIVLSGGPASVTAPDAPAYNPGLLRTEKPTLGICYGFQLIAHAFDGTVERGTQAEYGKTSVHITRADPLFSGLDDKIDAWMSHWDTVKEAPPEFDISAITENGITAGIQNPKRGIYGVQFHPEVTHTPKGEQILRNFVYNIAKCQPSYTLENAVASAIDYIDRTVKGRDVIVFASGGVDSTVAATLVVQAKKAGKNVGDVYIVHIDNGLMRANESNEVMVYLTTAFQGQKIIFKDASERFLEQLKGVTDPEQKRKIIGDEFVRVQMDLVERLNLSENTMLCQGTLYTDRIESGEGVGKKAAVIKSHHNVNSPFIKEKKAKGLLVEPNQDLYKDEVRTIGELLGLPHNLVWRQPFPGPGLAIRVVDQDVTREKLEIVRKAETIYEQELAKAGLAESVKQYFAVLLGSRAVGVMGDERTHAYAIGLRAVETKDFMTAEAVEIPMGVLKRVSTRVVNEIKGVNRVLYDLTTKPPGTIEFE